MAGPFILHNPDGTPKAGDAVFEQNMKSLCDEIGGYVTDSTGAVIYPEEG